MTSFLTRNFLFYMLRALHCDIYLYVPSYPKKYLFHHVIYIYRHRSHPTSRGVATVLGPLNGLVSALKTGLKGDKP